MNKGKYIKVIIVILFIGLLLFMIPYFKKYTFKEVIENVNFHTFAYKAEWEVGKGEMRNVKIDNSMFTEKINNIVLTKVFSIERVGENCDISGVKDNKIYFITINSNGYVETSEGDYYKVNDVYSLYDELIKEGSK